MKSVQSTNVAGSFYPADAAELQGLLSGLLASVEVREGRPKALIVPHAGYVYSGQVAASAYAQLRPWADLIQRVVLLAPSHRLAYRGLAYSSASQFATPLGNIDTDKAAIDRIRELPQVHARDDAFQGEHALEVQLPFLQALLADFRLVPLIAGDSYPEEVAEVLERIWGGPETLIVISSDLSHFLDYDTARAVDARTAAAIEQLRFDGISYQDACGRNPLNGLLLAAQKQHLRVQRLDLRNSGDTAGPRDRVVGYGAWAFYP